MKKNQTKKKNQKKKTEGGSAERQDGFGPSGSSFMATDIAAYVHGKHQIELGLRLWSTGIILELGESQKQEQPLRVCVGITGEGKGSSLDLRVLLSLDGFVTVKVLKALLAY